MYQHVNIDDFDHAFLVAGRYNQFTWESRQALFEYIEQFEENIGEEIELDPIALCCEWTEATYDKLRAEISHEEDLPEFSNEEILEYLRHKTNVIEVDEIKLLIMNY
jgi:hypothetical protein